MSQQNRRRRQKNPVYTDCIVHASAHLLGGGWFHTSSWQSNVTSLTGKQLSVQRARCLCVCARVCVWCPHAEMKREWKTQQSCWNLKGKYVFIKIHLGKWMLFKSDHVHEPTCQPKKGDQFQSLTSLLWDRVQVSVEKADSGTEFRLDQAAKLLGSRLSIHNTILVHIFLPFSSSFSAPHWALGASLPLLLLPIFTSPLWRWYGSNERWHDNIFWH